MKKVPTRTAGFYIGLYKNYWRTILVILALYLVKHGVWMVLPLLIRYVIDDFIPAQNLTLIFLCIPVVIVLGIINLACHIPYRIITIGLIKKVSRDLRNQVINKLQILSISLINESETGRQYSKIMLDVLKAEQFAMAVFTQLLGALLTFLYAGLFLMLINPKMMLSLIIILPVYVVIYRSFSSRFTQYQHKARLADENLSQAVNEFIQTNILTRLHGEEEFERNKVDARSQDVMQEYKKIHGSIGFFGILVATTSQLFQITIIAFASVAVIQNLMTIGELVVFYQYMSQMLQSVIGVMEIFPVFVESAESIESIHEILNSPDIEQNEDKLTLSKITGAIEFRNVSFSHQPGQPAINNISVSIKPGQTIALVGPSGAGKTTFINLALGLLRPDSGEIYIDGHNINDIDMRSVRKFVGAVTQQPIIFRGTVAENIAHARPEARLEEVQAAAQKANAHEFIMQMENQYDTMIGEDGATLSGGQKQRLAIARAILRRPSLLVLDEATSALDSISEKEVQKGISAMLGQQTTLTIAHRLSTVRKADLILVLQDRQVVEMGSHEELVRNGGVYASLYTAQTES